VASTALDGRHQVGPLARVDAHVGVEEEHLGRLVVGALGRVDQLPEPPAFAQPGEVVGPGLES
jgi:hypothetical protein